MKPVQVTTPHACGDTHMTTAWTTATPGLVVFRDGPVNNPCGLHGDDEEWHVWNQPAGGDGAVILGGFGDPESAMAHADQLGRYRDWTQPGPIVRPSIREMVDDIDARRDW